MPHLCVRGAIRQNLWADSSSNESELDQHNVTLPSVDKHAPYPFDHRKALRALRASDAKMAALIAAVGPFRMPLERHEHPYESLFHSIQYQQLHGKAAAAILARVKEQIGGGGYPAPRVLLAASDEALRGAGLSRQKIAALRDLADKTIAGTVPGWEAIQRLGDEEVIERLTQVRGVGVWTVHMLLIFRLGRPDVWPTLDYGVRHGYQLAYRKRRMPTPKELEKVGEKWRPYRSVAAWYFWQRVHLERGGK
ncbi:MAG: DNA-3-methyladenine glycosylase 2 family protein [Acidobacteria bacterium]|nr:MAG: DNA-3-methyladenine glycosylase 2 family protein [Acidobacteriota bacterium]